MPAGVTLTVACRAGCADLKCGNVLLQHDHRDKRGYCAKVADFGARPHPFPVDSAPLPPLSDGR